MVLSDWDIQMMLDVGELRLDPTELALVQPSSVDLRLDVFARRLRADVAEVDTRADAEVSAAQFEELHLDAGGYAVQPGEMLICQTYEYLKLPTACQGLIAQRSGLVRIGLHVSSSLVNPGYEGNLPCLVANHSHAAVRIYPGMPFCQLVLLRLSATPRASYGPQTGGKYQGERRILPSRISEDVKRWAPAGPRLADPAQAHEFEMKVEADDVDKS